MTRNVFSEEKVTAHEACSMKYRTVEILSSYKADRKERKQRGK